MKQQQSASCLAGSGAQGQERVYLRGPLGKLTRCRVAALAAPALFPEAPQLCSACGLRQPGALWSLPSSWLEPFARIVGSVTLGYSWPCSVTLPSGTRHEGSCLAAPAGPQAAGSTYRSHQLLAADDPGQTSG